MSDINWRDVQKCSDYIRKALKACGPRVVYPDWVENELMAVTLAANEWAVTHGTGHAVTIDEVRRLDTMASGHIDWAKKLCLYAAEAAYGLRVEA